MPEPPGRLLRVASPPAAALVPARAGSQRVPGKNLAPLAGHPLIAYTIAAELGDIGRFPSPRKLAGYSGLCPRVYQSGASDRRGALAKNRPRYLRWALVEAATGACRHPAYRERYQRTKARLGPQRGARVAQVELARRLSEAIWHMLTRNQPFAPAGATNPLTA